jgi:hypothetical protein
MIELFFSLRKLCIRIIVRGCDLWARRCESIALLIDFAAWSFYLQDGKTTHFDLWLRFLWREGRILGGSFAKILLKKKLGLSFLVTLGPGT